MVVIALSALLLNKNKNAFRLVLSVLLLFVLQNTFDKWQVAKQQKLIVYNVPQHRAIDFIDGNSYQFVGDSILKEDGLFQNFHLKPARISLGLNIMVDTLHNLFHQNLFYQFNNKRILLINEPLIFEPIQQKVDVDIIIISKNPKLYIPQLVKVFSCDQYVFDASNSLWKIGKWQKDCEALHLRWYSIPEQGAFVSDL